MHSKYIIGGFQLGGLTIRNNGAGIQVDGDPLVVLLPGATQRDANEPGDLPPLDPATVPGKVAPVGTATPAPAYESELGQLVRIWNGKVDVNGNLLGKDGEVITVPDKGEPLRQNNADGWAYASEQELLDDIAAKNYNRKVKMYGVQGYANGDVLPYTQYNADPPAGFGAHSDGSGRLVAMQINPEPVPVLKIPAPPAGHAVVLDVPFPTAEKPQMYYDTTAFGKEPYTYRFRIPTEMPTFNPNNLGIAVFAELPGQTVVGRDYSVTINDAADPAYRDNGGNTSPAAQFSINNPTHPNASFHTNSGDLVAVKIINPPGLPYPTANGRFDLGAPWRYV